jgi:hypothetical protein
MTDSLPHRVFAAHRRNAEMAPFRLESDLVVLIDPEAFGGGIEGAGRPLCRDDPSDPATRHLTTS